MRAFKAWCRVALALLVMVVSALGQTADDPGEGLRIELSSTSNVFAIKWWGKTGRTYFVQSNPTLNPNTWSFMPVVETGSHAVQSWNLSTTGERMFVRLVYTDQLYSGSASLADFDGDGLTNAQEVASSGPRSNPLNQDTDGDGFSDGVEWNGNFNPLTSLSLPSAAAQLQAQVVESWDLAVWIKENGPPKTYSWLKDTETAQWPDELHNWSTTVPVLPMPPVVRDPGQVPYGGWSSYPLWNGESYDGVIASAYNVQREVDASAAPENMASGGRDLHVRYGQLRLVANYPSLFLRTRLVLLNLQSGSAQMSPYGGWNGATPGAAGQTTLLLFLPPGALFGVPQPVQLTPTPGTVKFASAQLLPEQVSVGFITPSGDPVSAPVDAGAIPSAIPDGANEFTFSNATTGVLTLKLKAVVPGIGSLPFDEQIKFTFDVDPIGNSVLTWDAANPGGRATVSSDFITATATFTGLPQNNSDFGLKRARVKYADHTAGQASFEAFYDAKAKNHPGGDPAHTNWFHYYKNNHGGGAYGYDDNGHNNSGRSGSLSQGGDGSIVIGPEAFDGDQYITTAIQNAKLKATGVSTINKYYANFCGVVAHERQHANNQINSGGSQDVDNDRLANDFEINTSLTDPNDDTSAGRGTIQFAGWFDREIYAGGPVEENAINAADTSKDWASPGTNKKP